MKTKKKESKSVIIDAKQKNEVSEIITDKENLDRPKIHFGRMIDIVMRKRGLSRNKLAKAMKVTPPTVSVMVSNRSLHTEKLLEVSKVLDYNFFREAAEQLNYEEPVNLHLAHTTSVNQNITESGKKLIELEIEMKLIRDENEYLRKIVELLAVGGKN